MQQQIIAFTSERANFIKHFINIWSHIDQVFSNR
jgi:hypothetical protein